jgi:hypothetical protein
MGWSIPRAWEGETAAILASGPSMSQAVADTVRGRVRVIAVSNQGIPTRCPDGSVRELAPWADVLYSSDRAWWTNNREAALRFAGVKLTIESNEARSSYFKHPAVYALKNAGPHGFSDATDTITTGRNSGYAAAHVAAHFGATTILLCGFDMKPPAKPGASHWFGDHSFRPMFVSPYSLFVSCFERGFPEFQKRGIRLINCTPDSALTFLPYQPIEVAVREAEQRREAARMQRVREGASVPAARSARAP